MKIVSASDFRKNLTHFLTLSTEDFEPIAITTQKKEPSVLIPMSMWNSIEETMYLLGNPANARRLKKTIANWDPKEHDLIDA